MMYISVPLPTFFHLCIPAFVMSTASYISYLEVSALQPFNSTSLNTSSLSFLRKLPKVLNQYGRHQIQNIAGLPKSALIVLRMSGFIHDDDIHDYYLKH